MVKIIENGFTEVKVRVFEVRCRPYKNGRDGRWLQIVTDDDGAKYSAFKGAEQILEKFRKHDADWWTLKCFRLNDYNGKENWIVNDAEPARQDLGIPTTFGTNSIDLPKGSNLSDQRIQKIAVECIENTKAQGRERWIDALENYGPTEADVFAKVIRYIKCLECYPREVNDLDKSDFDDVPGHFSRYSVLNGADSFSEMQILCETFGLNYEYARRRWKWPWIMYN